MKTNEILEHVRPQINKIASLDKQFVALEMIAAALGLFVMAACIIYNI